MSDELDSLWDVVVVGSGGAGLTAATTAAHAGLRVLVVEKAAWVGGATAWSGGNVWVPGNGLCKETSSHPSPSPGSDRQDARRYLLALAQEFANPELLDAFLEAAPRMVAFLQEHTAVQFECQPRFGDHHPHIGGACGSGRCITPVPFDGRLLGKRLNDLREPLPQVNAPFGMMIGFDDIEPLQCVTRSARAFVHVIGMVARLLRDRWRYGRGTRLTMGNALAARLLRSALDNNVTIWNNTPALRLLQTERRVRGVVVEREGREITVGARRGVFLASGGFSASDALRRQFMPRPQQHLSMMPDTHTGDGLQMAQRVGAALETRHYRNGDWTVISAMENANGSLTKCLHTVLDKPKPGCIAVDGRGARFVNEAGSEIADALHHDAVLPAYLICDQRFLRKYGLGLVPPGGFAVKRYQAAGYLHSAPDIATLAASLQVDGERLTETVTRFNRFAIAGEDLDFGRGASHADRLLGDSDHHPNPSLGALQQPPFHAVQIHPGDASSWVGLRINRYAQVLRDGGSVVSGLYAGGLDAHSLWRGRPPSVGANNALSLTLGFLAGEHMAGVSEAGEETCPNSTARDHCNP